MLALGLGVVQLGAVQVGLTDAAADAARMVGRGDPPGEASSRVASVTPGASMAIAASGSIVCVTASASVSLGRLGSLFELTGRGCALDDRQGGERP